MNISEKALKCLNLALNNSAPEGEWNAAAIRFCAILRRDHVCVETLFERPEPTSKAPRQKRTTPKPKPAAGTMPFGKFKGQPLSDLPDWYVDWCLEQDFVKDLLRAELEKVKATRTEQTPT